VWPVRVEVFFRVGLFFSFAFLSASQNTFQKGFGPAICRDRFARRRALGLHGGRPSNRGDHRRKYDLKYAQLHDILSVGRLSVGRTTPVSRVVLIARIL
jgi:hypothetical protein